MVAGAPFAPCGSGGASVRSSRARASNDAWAVVRFKPNGRLDSTFGNGGKVVTNWSGANDEAWGVLVLRNGKIVVAGYARGTFAAARYTPTGQVDTSFGDAGSWIADA